MYAVIRYFNYRKGVSFTILQTFNSLTRADHYALKRAEDEFGSKDVVQGVSERWVHVDEVIDGYTKGDGYDQFVYSVIEFNGPEEEEIEEVTGFKIKKQKNGKYEWGFDLTDFNDDSGKNKGASKFQELLNKFEMELVSMKEGFMWENEGSIVMVTANNPLTGKHHNIHREIEKGYLSYVGISCESPEILQEFINEFRKNASYIKEESNARQYI